MATTWNLTDNLNLTLSNGNLTTGGTGGVGGGTRSTTSMTSGKLYFELQYAPGSSSTAGTTTGGGIANSGYTLGSSGTTGAAFQVANAAGTGDVRINNSTVVNGNSGSITTGTYIGIAVDIGGTLFWETTDGIHWNSNSSGVNDPATGTGGQSFSAITGPYFIAGCVASSGSSTRGLILNAGASAFHYTVPSGFSAWDGINVALMTGMFFAARTIVDMGRRAWQRRRGLWLPDPVWAF